MTLTTELPTLGKAKKRTRTATAQPAPAPIYHEQSYHGKRPVIECLGEDGAVDLQFVVSDRAAMLFKREAKNRPHARLRYLSHHHLTKLASTSGYKVNGRPGARV